MTSDWRAWARHVSRKAIWRYRFHSSRSDPWVKWSLNRIESIRKQSKSKSKSVRLSISDVIDLLERQGKRCALSGVKLTPENATLDHIVPVSQGGEHTLDNLQVLASQINNMKSTMDQREFVRWCSLVARHSGGRRGAR